MRILLTNDDGIYHEALWALQDVLARQHEVCIVAPDKERSAVGHSITLASPLRFQKVRTNGGWGYAVNGTPADCVKLAVLEILKARPDLVVSGINPGANVGVNLNYSGTVSAAKEAALMGIPAIAVSQKAAPDYGYKPAADFVEGLIAEVMGQGLPSGTFLNVNIPPCALTDVAGIRITRQGTSPLREILHKRTDPRKQIYYWRGIETHAIEQGTDTDVGALSRNYISVTPVQCDMTDYQTMEHLKKWHIRLV